MKRLNVPEALEDERLKDEGMITPGFIHSTSPEKTYLHFKMPDRWFSPPYSDIESILI